MIATRLGSISRECASTQEVQVSLSAQNPPQTPPTPPKKSSYMPVVETESFAIVQERMSAAKAAVMKHQMDLLAERYDLSYRPAEGVAWSWIAANQSRKVCE
jgi:hypothetical protein